MFFRNQWGSVCTDSTKYLQEASDALCRRLGFAGTAVSDSTSDFGTAIGPVWVDSFPQWCRSVKSDPLSCVQQWGSFDETACRNDMILVCNST